MANNIYTLNANYFDQIDTEDKAYFLGLLYTDGCNYENDGFIKIDLSEEDCYILEQLKDCIEYTGVISHYPAERKIINGEYYDCQPSCRLQMRSKHMSSVLASYGMVSNKSSCGMYIKDEIVPGYLYHHFVRGLIDGDGGISYWVDNPNTGHKKFQINFCSAADSVEKLANYLGNRFACTPTISSRYPDKDNNNLQFSICGNNNVREITDWIYQDAHYYLKRKYDKYQELIAENERKANNKNLYGFLKPRRSVIHLVTGKVYESLADAEKDTGVNKSNICTQAKKGNGKWAYYDNNLINLVK